MLLFALSFQEQVEKYGVYVGIAAFFGLAVMSLLYFAQARELKRLREWAGRAPDRARELEQRVVAQAVASASRRAPAMPGAKGAIAPPRRLAEMPAPQAGAQTAAGAQATELADAVPAEDEPATNGNVPAAPGAAAASGANGAAPPAEDEAVKDSGEAGDEQPADAEAQPAEAGADGRPAADETALKESGSEESAGEDAVAEKPVSEEPADEESVADESAAALPAGAASGAAAAAARADEPAAPASEPEHAAEPQRPVTPPGEVPAAVPRATPAQRVGVTPRAPAPMPLRQTRPSATPSGRGAPPRRPGAAAPGRPAGTPREGRSAGTIALFVGLAVLILGGGVFLVSQLGGDEAPPAPNRAAPPPTQTDTGEEQPAEPTTPPAETNVAVLNGTTFTGLAGQLADRVSQEGGFERGAVETNTRDQTIQTSTIYFADGFRPSARKVGELLSISSLEPLDDETQALAPDADVVVLAGADQAP